MKECFRMWKYTKMVVLTALSAAIYAAVLIPFKSLVLIPGITEVRPGSALPVVLGLLFGPAGAWGAAIGNLIGDFFGSLGPGSIFGFVGNFLFAYIPYVIWYNLGIVSKNDNEPNLKSGRKIVNYIVCAILGSVACALTIGWGLDVLKLVPFSALGIMISLNNSIPAVILGIPILAILYPRIKRWDLLWGDIMEENDMPKLGAKSTLSAVVTTLAIVAGYVLAIIASLGISNQVLFSYKSGAGSPSVDIIAGIAVVVIFAAQFVKTKSE